MVGMTPDAGWLGVFQLFACSHGRTRPHSRSAPPWLLLCLFALLGDAGAPPAWAQVTVTYDMPATSYAGWQMDPCGTVDRGTSTAGLVDTGAYTDVVPPGSTVTNVQFTVMHVYDGGSSCTFRLNGTALWTITGPGGAT